MMETNRILEKIVEESIRNVLCVDDGLIEPYEESEDGEMALEFSKDLYRGISDNCRCSVTMMQYSEKTYEDNLNKRLIDKDMLVLDWELDVHGINNIKMPLNVIYQALENNIPYICIYTNSSDLTGISKLIEMYFSGFSIQEVNDKVKCWESEGIMKELFFDDLNSLYEDEDRRIFPQILNKVKEYCQKIDCKKCNYKERRQWFPLYLKWNGFLLPEKVKYRADRVENGENVLNIGGRLLFVFSKKHREENNKDSISPEAIIPTIAKYITCNPNSIMNCIWLYFSNRYAEAVGMRTQYFKDISYPGFLHHIGGMLASEDDSLEMFLKELFNDELLDIMNSQKIGIPEEIICKIKKDFESINSNNLRELVKINERMTINKRYSSFEHKIDFGDVFYCENAEGNLCEYWMCITAKCDCARPEQKIQNNYIFIGGECVTDKHALKNAEQGFFSFIYTIDGNKENPICIEWCKKINSILIKDNLVNLHTKISGNVRGQEREFTYLGSVKENFAQRMANEAYSYGNRVGVSLAKI